MSEFNEETPMISIRLSKSGKAIMIHDKDGHTWMTSVAFMKMLCDGKAKNNMIPARLMGFNVTDNFKNTPTEQWDSSKITQVEGNPLSLSAEKQRQQGSVKVKGDW